MYLARVSWTTAKVLSRSWPNFIPVYPKKKHKKKISERKRTSTIMKGTSAWSVHKLRKVYYSLCSFLTPGRWPRRWDSADLWNGIGGESEFSMVYIPTLTTYNDKCREEGEKKYKKIPQRLKVAREPLMVFGWHWTDHSKPHCGATMYPIREDPCGLI